MNETHIGKDDHDIGSSSEGNRTNSTEMPSANGMNLKTVGVVSSVDTAGKHASALMMVGWGGVVVATFVLATLNFFRLGQIRSREKCASGRSNPIVSDSRREARRLEQGSQHAMAGYYWRNAIEHASDDELLSVLNEYAETVFKAPVADDTAFAEATTLERLAELALVRVPPDKMTDAFALRDRCVAFRETLVTDEQGDDDEGMATDFGGASESHSEVAKSVADSVEALLNELAKAIADYAGTGSTGTASGAEYKILQLSGVTENAMSQLWFLDRSGLDAAETERIDSFPKRLADLINAFNEKHDAPLLGEIRSRADATPPETKSSAPHQRNVEFYTNQAAKASAMVRYVRGADAQAEVQQWIAAIMGKVADEKRQQMNEYQKFVANCCKLAFDSWDDAMNIGSIGFGRVPKGKGYKDESDFILKYVREFARSVPLSALISEKDRRLIYARDNWIPQALQRESGGPNYWDVKNEHKSFIITAIYGFYRIDQSLLTPETSRLFNDVFQKYYEKMDSARKVWSVRWMVEEPKVRLEDF